MNREIDRLSTETQGMRETGKRVDVMMRELQQASVWEKERNGIEKERLLQEGEEEAGSGSVGFYAVEEARLRGALQADRALVETELVRADMHARSYAPLCPPL